MSGSSADCAQPISSLRRKSRSLLLHLAARAARLTRLLHGHLDRLSPAGDRRSRCPCSRRVNRAARAARWSSRDRLFLLRLEIGCAQSAELPDILPDEGACRHGGEPRRIPGGTSDPATVPYPQAPPCG